MHATLHQNQPPDRATHATAPKPTDRGRVPQHHVERALGHARAVRQLGEGERREGRLLGGLEDDGAAGGEGGGDLRGRGSGGWSTLVWRAVGRGWRLGFAGIGGHTRGAVTLPPCA
jgi:hypothetical protein